MNFNISFDPIRLIGNAVLAFIGGFVGNFTAALIMAAVTPALDGGSLYAFAGVLMLATSMFFVKAIVAFVVAAVAMVKASTPGKAALWSFSTTAAIGFFFSMVVGIG